LGEFLKTLGVPVFHPLYAGHGREVMWQFFEFGDTVGETDGEFVV
jgi:hypothetical protein